MAHTIWPPNSQGSIALVKKNTNWLMELNFPNLFYYSPALFFFPVNFILSSNPFSMQFPSWSFFDTSVLHEKPYNGLYFSHRIHLRPPWSITFHYLIQMQLMLYIPENTYMCTLKYVAQKQLIYYMLSNCLLITQMNMCTTKCLTNLFFNDYHKGV